MATCRPSLVSLARYTSPIPPAPMAERISYGPSLSPDERGMFGSHPSVYEEAARSYMRIVQYKMILKQDLIPIQDDPENVKGQGVPRPDANTYAERRIADLGADPGVPQGQPDHRVPR